MAGGVEPPVPPGSGESGPGVVRWSLLQDDALILEVDRELTPVAGAWVPISHRDGQGLRPPSSQPAVLRLRAPGGGSPPPPGEGVPPLFGLGSVRGWLVPESGELRLRGARGAGGGILPGARRAELTAPPDIGGSADGVMEIHSLLTLSAGLVLPTEDAALVHAAAVVAPGVGALLLVGDSHAGKTTTCANLVEEGWRFLSDDHTVLRGGGAEGVGEITVEGWLRTMHLDGGWRGGTPTGVREDTDPGVLAPGLWCASAPLAGLLFPRVEADRPTRIEPMTPGQGLVELIRQCPWLMADAAGAPRALGFLRRAALHPAFRLRLGLDTFRNGRRLAEVLEEAFPRGVRRAGMETV